MVRRASPPTADWLNALIYAMATRDLLFGRFAVTLHDHVLDAKVWGQSLDRERHQPSVEVKAVTYTELSMAQRGSEISWKKNRWA